MVLLISERAEKISFFGEIFSQNTPAFYVASELAQVLDIISVSPPDIIIIDTLSSAVKVKSIIRKINSVLDNPIIILIVEDKVEKDLIKLSNAFITDDMSKELVEATINVNLRMKNSLAQLSDSNKDLADSLYMLNTLYNTSSQFASTLDKNELIKYMVEGLDKSLSFSLTCTLSFCNESHPILILNSLYDISEELLSAIKLRMIFNYKSLFGANEPPYNFDEESLEVVKYVKYPASKFTFTLFQYDNLFAPISQGDNFFGCIEIFKDTHFSSEDAKCFQTIVQQVALPLKNASLYQEIKETNQKLEKLERLKSEFISIVSHELRTPLTSIKNSLDILHSGRCGEVTSASDKFLSMAKRNVQRLSGIINDLLDLSKIEAGKMDFHFSKIDVHNVIEYVKSTFVNVAKEKGLSLCADETLDLPFVYADSQRLEQVLTNLVSNAIKFTPSGKNITIKSQLINAKDVKIDNCFKELAKKLDGDYIMVSVLDEGIGIAEENLLRAFDKFAQIENSLSRKVGGSGLGLPIAKQLIEAHNGIIWCESQLEKGSKFIFVIPVAEN